MAQPSTESAVELHFPRIAKMLTDAWATPEFEKVANSLMVDERGGRQGFPKDVIGEIFFLYTLHLELTGFDPKESFDAYSDLSGHTRG